MHDTYVASNTMENGRYFLRKNGLSINDQVLISIHECIRTKNTVNQYLNVNFFNLSVRLEA